MNDEIQKLRLQVRCLWFAVGVLLLLNLCTLALGQSPASEVRTAVQWAQRQPQRARYTKFVSLYAMDDRIRGYVATSYAVNLVSEAGAVIQPEWVGEYLLAIDLAQLYPQRSDLERAWFVWESFAATDPYFHQRATLGGKSVSVDAAWVDPNDMAKLRALCGGTNVPILRADWFIVQAMQSKNYYQLRGIADTREKYLASLGLDEKLVIALRAVRAANLPQSGVTHQLRRVTRWPTPNGSVWITFDSVASANAEKDPFAAVDHSLKFDASELIATLPSGAHEFSLFLADGKRADVVDPQLAIDDSGQRPIPLTPPFSCVRCHSQENSNGLRSFTDAQLPLISRGVRTIASADPNVADTVASLYYAGDKLQRDLVRDRIDYIAAIKRLATIQGRQPTVSGAASCLDYAVTSYTDSLVTPEQACRELGLRYEESAVDAIRRIGFLSNAAPVKFLSDGKAVQRSQFESVYSELALLAMAKGAK